MHLVISAAGDSGKTVGGSGKGKSKAKAKAKGNAKCKAKAVASKPKTKAKANAIGKPNGPEAKAQEKTVAKQANAPKKIKLGCSKCRGSKIGCGQCRDPRFNGKRFQK